MNVGSPVSVQKKKADCAATQIGQIIINPIKVYHIVKAKGTTAMLELKITVSTAEELNQEIKDLYEKLVGAPLQECHCDKEEKPKTSTKKATPKKVEAHAPVAPEPVEEPAVPETVEAAHTFVEVRAAVGAWAKDDDKKAKLRELLAEVGAAKLSEVKPEDFHKFMELCNG